MVEISPRPLRQLQNHQKKTGNNHEAMEQIESLPLEYEWWRRREGGNFKNIRVADPLEAIYRALYHLTHATALSLPLCVHVVKEPLIRLPMGVGIPDFVLC